MQRAIDLSIESINSGGGPFGSVIAKGNEVISEGMNRVTVNNDPTAHGEITAIRQACKKLNTFDLTGYELYTNCEPCPMCLSAIYWSHIDKVYYANTRDDAYKIDFLDPIIYTELQKSDEEKKIQIVQMMRAEGLKAFEIWDKKVDKIKY